MIKLHLVLRSCFRAAIRVVNRRKANSPQRAIRSQPTHLPPLQRIDQHLRIFQSFKPLEFRVVSDPTAAEDWLLRISKILDGMVCPEDRRVVLATFMLEGEAERWWQAQQGEILHDPSHSDHQSWDLQLVKLTRVDNSKLFEQSVCTFQNYP